MKAAVAGLGLVKGGSKVKTKTILATPTTGLAHYCTAHSNKDNLHYALYKNIIASSLKNKNLSYLRLYSFS